MPSPPTDPVRVLSREDAGRRLDLVLAAWLGLSRAGARALLGSGQVALDGRALGPKDKGRIGAAGAELRVERFVPPHEQRPAAPTGPAPPVLAEGPGWIAVDKPAGLPVHPLRQAETETALGHVALRHPEIHGVGEGGLRSGVVHRLDVDTSGVLLFATDEACWERLRRAFTEQRVDKRYRAIVHGSFTEERQIELSVRVAQHKPARVRVLEAGAAAKGDERPICMRVRPLEALRGATLVEVAPKTGFLHQIRVALAHAGHPLLGDRVYGHAEAEDAASRHMLHASALRFEEIEAQCEAPADLCAALEARRL